MESTLPANQRDTYPTQPQFTPPTAAARVETAATSSRNLPLEILAATPFGDTDFRRQLGIERWGWGLND